MTIMHLNELLLFHPHKHFNVFEHLPSVANEYNKKDKLDKTTWYQYKPYEISLPEFKISV